jgi:hypothetical protein
MTSRKAKAPKEVWVTFYNGDEVAAVSMTLQEARTYGADYPGPDTHHVRYVLAPAKPRAKKRGK